VVVLLYVFNDIDYLSPVTRRSMLTDAPRTVWQTLHPLRLAYKNSFLFQELYVRARALLFPLSASGGPYDDPGILRLHLRDLAEFVRLASDAGAVVGIVPLDVAGMVSPSGYAAFLRAVASAGLPVWPIDRAFRGQRRGALVVNRLDHHPNVLANRLAAAAALPQVLEALRRGRTH